MTDVLIIDDLAEARALMGDVLAQAGFNVHELESPIGATRLVVRKSIAVVVLDLHMPTMGGDKLAQLFRNNPRFQDLRLVLVSAEQRPLLEQLGAEAGADACLTKSEVVSSLADVVSKLTQHTGQRNS
jgi:two-component system chemotaxis response regulator CheY